MNSLKDHARGKWPHIIATLLGDDCWTETRKHQACPRGQGTDCFRFSNKHENGNFFCKCSDGADDGFDLLRCVNGWDFHQAAEAVESVIGKPEGPLPEKPKPHWIFRLWREATEQPRSRYLESRDLAPAAPLRFHRSVPYYEGGKLVESFAAMLAPVYHGKKLRAIHVTYLEGDRKADVKAPRKFFSHLSVREGFVPLGGMPSGALSVAEGIETALSVPRLVPGATCWAALNTSLLKNFTPPEGVARVIVCGDNDESFAGHAAAYRLAERLTAKGLTVHVAIPETAGCDWNDELSKASRAVLE